MFSRGKGGAIPKHVSQERGVNFKNNGIEKRVEVKKVMSLTQTILNIFLCYSSIFAPLYLITF